MNELRKKIESQIDRAYDIVGDGREYESDFLIKEMTGFITDAILNAVIAALPEEKPVPAYKEAIKWSQGYREAVLDTKAMLLAAKESK